MSRADSLAASDKAVQEHVINGEATDAEILAGDIESKHWVSVRRFVKALSSFALRASPSLTGEPKAPTPPQFDNTVKISTTEFVQRALGSLAGSREISVSETLPAADIGKRLELKAGVTLILPSTSSVSEGSAVLISAGPASTSSRVSVAAGDYLAFNNIAVGVPYTLAPGGDFIAIRETNTWRCHVGSEVLRTAPVMSGPYWATRPQFDNTKSFATTEFVNEAAGGLRRTIQSLTQGQAIAASQVNSLFYAVGGASSATLPLLSSVPYGSTLTFAAMSSSLTLLRQGTDTIWATSANPNMTAINVNLGDTLTLVAAPFGWVCSGGSAMLAYQGNSGVFGSALAANGYQKLPSGRIEQWGIIALPTGASTAPVAITFPIAFPTGAFQVVAGIGVVIADYDSSPSYRLARQEVSMGIPTLTGCEGQAFVDNSYADNRAIYWRALGK